jgi:hypothetical protein
MTSAQQRATKRYRDRRRKSGLQRLEVQVPAAEADVIRKAAEILRARRKRRRDCERISVSEPNRVVRYGTVRSTAPEQDRRAHPPAAPWVLT